MDFRLTQSARRASPPCVQRVLARRRKKRTRRRRWSWQKGFSFTPSNSFVAPRGSQKRAASSPFRASPTFSTHPVNQLFLGGVEAERRVGSMREVLELSVV